MTEPNPWSREGATGAPAPQPSVNEPAQPDPAQPDLRRIDPAPIDQASYVDQAGAWPSYPPAPNTFGYDGDAIPDYPGQPDDRSNPYDNAYPTSYPAPYTPPTAPVTAYGYPTSPYGPATPAAYPYTAGPYGYTPTNHPQAVAALVLGVVGLIICSYAGIAAFFVGQRARKEILAQPQRYSGLGMATAGWVMGIIGMVLSIFVTLFFVIGLSGGFDS